MSFISFHVYVASNEMVFRWLYLSLMRVGVVLFLTFTTSMLRPDPRQLLMRCVAWSDPFTLTDLSSTVTPIGRRSKYVPESSRGRTPCDITSLYDSLFVWFVDDVTVALYFRRTSLFTLSSLDCGFICTFLRMYTD